MLYRIFKIIVSFLAAFLAGAVIWSLVVYLATGSQATDLSPVLVGLLTMGVLIVVLVLVKKRHKLD